MPADKDHPVVLVSAPYIAPQFARFQPVLTHYGLDWILPAVTERLEEEDILAYAGQFDGVISGDDRFSARVLEACAPRLKVIAKWGTGIDSIDQKAAARLGILVRNTPNAFTLPVSDSVLGYILTFARHLPWMDQAIKSGAWGKIPGKSLSECTLGVVGIGNIGKAVLRRARPFGMRLLGNDIIPIAPDFVLENNVKMVSLRELLGQSDFISLNCDLNPTSRHLINPKTLGWVKRGAVLINLARGPIVDEPALVQALQSGVLSGAALDVFEVEPLPLDSPLRQMSNVLLAPHNANSSPSAWERVHLNTLRNLLEGLGISSAGLSDFFPEGV
jgi:D-3-phosphoglycerate dehydrogenase / 2-oxoglutarate reductase